MYFVLFCDTIFKKNHLFNAPFFCAICNFNLIFQCIFFLTIVQQYIRGSLHISRPLTMIVTIYFHCRLYKSMVCGSFLITNKHSYYWKSMTILLDALTVLLKSLRLTALSGIATVMGRRVACYRAICIQVFLAFLPIPYAHLASYQPMFLVAVFRLHSYTSSPRLESAAYVTNPSLL